MRQLNSEELQDKFRDYSFDIELSNYKDCKTKIDQLFNFLFEQNISNRILERFSEDFLVLKNEIEKAYASHNNKLHRELKQKLKTREIQGAFGYFTILEKFSKNEKHSNPYLDLTRDWDYNRGGDYNNHKQELDEYFFKPFVELFNWYLSESITKEDKDYFSNDTQKEILKNLEEVKEILFQNNLKRDNGQELIYDEIEELKELMLFLNKKNWSQIIKGKIMDLVLGGIISLDTANVISKLILGESSIFLQ